MAEHQQLDLEGMEEKHDRARQMHAIQLQDGAEMHKSLERQLVDTIGIDDWHTRNR
jgi:hypothetical protein